MPTLTRRYLFVGAAATAVVAALPAVAIAEQGFDLDRFFEFVVAQTERLHPGSNGVSKKPPRIFTAKYLEVPWMPRDGHDLKSGQHPSSS